MSYDWKDYYELSKELGLDAESDGENLSEAKFRCSISRAYYALFNVARIFAEANGYVYDITMGGRHEALINFFVSRTDQDSKKIAMELGSCKDFRVVADYHDELDLTRFHPFNKIKDSTITRVQDIFDLIAP